ncbi:universal stress protein [Variovorax sp. Root434]|uniref:universal stress protein n=1 Tax=unclassified Variovorax TaxID=663243 RepID=UPI0006FDCA83|nr:universal stress protein [Variovorax sp. Root434]KQX35495.1 universal stress protein UspA [Variovorax sp. Root434]
MTLSTISVHLDHTERCEARTLLAARIARLHRSHLMGIVPTGCTPAPSRPCSEEPAGSALVEASLYLRRRAETVAHVFRSRLRPTPLSCDARLVDGEPVQAVVHLARASDLVVVGQADEAAAVGSAERRLPEEVMLNAGRPVLIVPSTGCVKEGLDRILVAWDGSREASISLRGAMPLLRKAAHVTLVSLLRDGDANPADALNPVEMSGWLLRHGVQANVERLTTSLRFADVLLDRAEALGCELLVMGGYGHARVREQLLGGVTRDMLMQAGIPLLMAH